MCRLRGCTCLPGRGRRPPPLRRRADRSNRIGPVRQGGDLSRLTTRPHQHDRAVVAGVDGQRKPARRYTEPRWRHRNLVGASWTRVRADRANCSGRPDRIDRSPGSLTGAGAAGRSDQPIAEPADSVEGERPIGRRLGWKPGEDGHLGAVLADPIDRAVGRVAIDVVPGIAMRTRRQPAASFLHLVGHQCESAERSTLGGADQITFFVFST
jgi:hypothetical protein